MTTPRPPTDKQLARLRAAVDKANLRHAAVCERRINEVRAVTRKHQPMEWAAEKALNAARAALETAELAGRGIIPMHTVLQYRRALWAVRITSQGWPRLVPLKSDLTPHKGRSEDFMPGKNYKLIITDKVMKS